MTTAEMFTAASKAFDVFCDRHKAVDRTDPLPALIYQFAFADGYEAGIKQALDDLERVRQLANKART